MYAWSELLGIHYMIDFFLFFFIDVVGSLVVVLCLSNSAFKMLPKPFLRLTVWLEKNVQEACFIKGLRVFLAGKVFGLKICSCKSVTLRKSGTRSWR